jgi:predicted Zn-dependent peptidase
MFGGLHELAEYEWRVRSVTAPQMQALARAYFDAERRVEGIVRGTERAV